MSDVNYDVIIIGGGPNGEVLASYLAKAGAKVLIVERRHELGGGLLTEDFAGFRFNLHATYMMMAELMPPYHDLNLIEYGVEFIRPEVQASLFYDKNKALVFYLDPEKTAESIAKIAPEDSSKFLKLYNDFKRVCDECLIPATYVPPAPPAEYAAMLSETDIGRMVMEWSEMSPLEILESYEIKDDRVKAVILYLGCKWGIGPKTTGVGYMFPIYVYRMLNAALVKGGTHRLNSTILRTGYESGVEVKEYTEVKKIIIENGEAKGVITDTGEEIKAKAVVSTVDPHQTFLEFVGEENLSSDLVRTVKEWQWDEWSLFTIHLGTKTLPKYKAAETEPDCEKALLQIIGYSSVDDVIKHWEDCVDKKLPSPSALFTPTSLFDPSQAPKGYNVIRVETEAPYEVEGKDWEEIKSDYADSILTNWHEYLTNGQELKVVKRYIYPPIYIELKLKDMVRGSIKQGAYIPTQMGYFRPNIECSNYATPIKGLYVAGASVYPGGMITLGPGYAAARKVASDLGLNIWWKYPESIAKAKEKKLIP